MSNTKTIKIGEHTYVLAHLPGRDALRATARMGNAFAPLVAGFANGRGTGRLLSGLGHMLHQPELGAHLVFLADTFAPYTQVVFPTKPGEAPVTRSLVDIFDGHFAGRTKAMLEWLEAAVEYDIGDFLDDTRGKLAALLKSDAEDAAQSEDAQRSSTAPSPAAKTG